jgi:hypothetical protein
MPWARGGSELAPPAVIGRPARAGVGSSSSSSSTTTVTHKQCHRLSAEYPTGTPSRS